MKIALTGGIGTGKTFISHHFVEMGIPVYYADDEAKKIYNNDTVLLRLKQLFGTTIFPNNALDLGKLSQIVFNDLSQLDKLNKLIHPILMDNFILWASQQNAPSVMMESAIIFEANLTSFFDKIIVVDAPIEVRIKRIMQRSPQLSEQEILRRIEAQLPQQYKCEHAHLVINNS